AAVRVGRHGGHGVRALRRALHLGALGVHVGVRRVAGGAGGAAALLARARAAAGGAAHAPTPRSRGSSVPSASRARGASARMASPWPPWPPWLCPSRACTAESCEGCLLS